MTIEHVEAELAIRNLLAALAQHADTGSVEDYLALFTDDAVWEMPGNPATGVPASSRTGPDEIGAGVRERRATGGQGPGSNTLHSITTVRVEVDGPGPSGSGKQDPSGSGSIARGHVYWSFYGNTPATPALLTIGQYHDEYRNTADGWKLAHRSIVIG